MIEGVDLSFVIRKQADSLVVSVLPKSGSLKGDAANCIIPLVVNGTPAELDAGFIQSAFRPLQRVQGLITNIAQFEQQAEKTAVENKQSKGRSNSKPSNETKEEAEKRERYEKALKRADELIAAKSFEDALISLQQARLYAPSSQTKGIDDKIASVKQKLNQGSLFDVAPTAEQRPQSPTPPISQQQVAAAPIAPQAITRTEPIQNMPQSHSQAGTTASQPQYTPVQPRQAVPTAYTENGYTECETRYPQAMAAGETGTMPAYDNPEYPPSYRPEEYAEYPDFPQNMVAPSHARTNPNTQIF